MGNYANEFSIDFPFSFMSCSCALRSCSKWDENVGGTAACLTLNEGCQTARNYQPRKLFRWVSQSPSFPIMSKVIVKTRNAFTTREQTGVNLSACLTRGLTTSSLLRLSVHPLGNTEIDSARIKETEICTFLKWLSFRVVRRTRKWNEFFKTPNSLCSIEKRSKEWLGWRENFP